MENGKRRKQSHGLETRLHPDSVLLLVDNTGPDDYMFNDPRTVRWASLIGSFGQSIMAPLGNRLDPGPPEES